jgi:cytoskeletal protein RodZ
MPQGRTFLIVALVGLGAAGTWAWQHRVQQSEMKVASATQRTPAQVPASVPAPSPPPASEASPEPAPAQAAAPTPQNEQNDQSATPVSPAPADVDTPEPAERKFARGAHSSPEEH